MIKSISFERYRKLKNITLNFSKNVNAISGTNGTCKSSILYLISNSFQAMKIKDVQSESMKECLRLFSKVNKNMNLKIESLVKGDKKFNDPAKGTKGKLYTVEYFNGLSLDFRRHNSKKENRYSLKPKYRSGTKDKLPVIPVIYLGLSRLNPFGEFDIDENRVRGKCSDVFVNLVTEVFDSFTHYDIVNFEVSKMGDLKNRANFESKVDGIDSNTISAGEDNLMSIIQALVSLRYYSETFQMPEDSDEVHSVLLIDEVDATLHPAYQTKLLTLFREYSKKYGIQIVFTTHSLYLLDEMLKSKKDNVLYLRNNNNCVSLMEDVTKQKIEMYLRTLCKDDIYLNKSIPVFTEDAEARLILQLIFEYWNNNNLPFKNVYHFFHLLDANFGAEQLKKLFEDDKIKLDAICVLDGDQKNNLNNCIMCLPGKNWYNEDVNMSPEELLFDYVEYQHNSTGKENCFFNDRVVVDEGFDDEYYKNHIMGEISKIKNKLQSDNLKKDIMGEILKIKNKLQSDDLKKDDMIEDILELERKLQSNDLKKEKDRDVRKKIFNKDNNKKFFTFLFKHWCNNDKNKEILNNVYNNLKILFMKVAESHGISIEEWT